MMRLNKIRCHSLVIFTVSSLSNVSTEQLQQPYRAKHVLSLSAVLRISSVGGSPGNPKIPFHPAFDKGRKRDGDLTNLVREIFLCALRVPFANTRATGPRSVTVNSSIASFQHGVLESGRHGCLRTDPANLDAGYPCRHDKVFHFCFLRASVD